MYLPAEWAYDTFYNVELLEGLSDDQGSCVVVAPLIWDEIENVRRTSSHMIVPGT